MPQNSLRRAARVSASIGRPIAFQRRHARCLPAACRLWARPDRAGVSHASARAIRWPHPPRSAARSPHLAGTLAATCHVSARRSCQLEAPKIQAQQTSSCTRSTALHCESFWSADARPPGGNSRGPCAGGHHHRDTFFTRHSASIVSHPMRVNTCARFVRPGFLRSDALARNIFPAQIRASRTRSKCARSACAARSSGATEGQDPRALSHQINLDVASVSNPARRYFGKSVRDLNLAERRPSQRSKSAAR